MKINAQAFLLATLLGAGLFFAGCASSPKTAMRAAHRYVSEVVETSTDRPLTPAEIAQVRDGAIRFMESQTRPGVGNYYVRVDFVPDRPGAASGWAIIRITDEDAERYTLLAQYSEPNSGYNNPDDYYDGYPDFRTYSTSYGYYDPYDYYYPGYSRPLRPHHDNPDGRSHRTDGPRGDDRYDHRGDDRYDHRDGGRYDHRDGNGPAPVNHPEHRTWDGDDHSRPARGSRPANDGGNTGNRRTEEHNRSPGYYYNDGGRRPELAPSGSPARAPTYTRGSDGGRSTYSPPPSTSRETYSPPPPQSAPAPSAPAPTSDSSSRGRDNDGHTAR